MSDSSTDGEVNPTHIPPIYVQITMGTVIVSFIGNSFVASAQNIPQLKTLSPQRRRRVLVFVYYTCIVLLFTLFGVLIIPDVVREGYDFVSRLQTENLWVVVLEKMRKGLGYVAFVFVPCSAALIIFNDFVFIVGMVLWTN